MRFQSEEYNAKYISLEPEMAFVDTTLPPRRSQKNPAPVRDKFSTRCGSLDLMLGGGFSTGEVTVIYGEAGCGKTTLVTQAAIEAARYGVKSIFADIDHSFSHQRFSQLAGDKAASASEMLLLFDPETFADQSRFVEDLECYLSKAARLVIVDSFTTLYRVGLSTAEQTFIYNRELSRQLAYLNAIATRRNVALVLTSQVHSRITFPFGRVEPVAHRLLGHWSQTIVRIDNTSKQPNKNITIERLRNRKPHSLKRPVIVTERGFENAI